MAAVRQVLTMQHRLEDLTREVHELKRREEDTRERLIRIETIIDEARRAGEARRLPER